VRRWRERVRGLILLDTRAEADSAEGRRARDTLIARVREQGPLAAAEAMLPRFFTPQVSPDIIERIRTSILRTPVPGIVGALSAMRERPDSTPLLETLTGIPTLVLVGAEDVITRDSRRPSDGDSRSRSPALRRAAGADHPRDSQVSSVGGMKPFGGAGRLLQRRADRVL
jgi:pimeloyl-ACP methyl ester carboxylesterase